MPFTTEDEVRLQHGFHAEETFTGTGATGSTLTLRQQGYNIIEILKNGTAITDPTDYSFTPMKTITLVVAGIATDEFVATYATEVRTSVITANITWATEFIKAKLERRYSETVLGTWDTATPATDTPDFVFQLATTLAGLRTERAMLRKSHQFEPMAFNVLQKEIDSACMVVDRIAKGELEIPGEDSSTASAFVARGGNFRFADLQDWRRVNLPALDRGTDRDGRDLKDLEEAG